MRQRILIICDSDIAAAPRVQMEIEALLPFHDLGVAGTSYTGFEPAPGLTFVQLPPAPRLSTSLPARLARRVSRAASSILERSRRRWSSDAYMLRRSRRAEEKPWLGVLSKVNPDAVIVHHAMNLPLGVKLTQARGIPLIFNAHEFYPSQFDGNPWWEENVKPVTEFICRTFMPQADAVLTVCEGIAEEYKRRFGVNATVLMSTKPFHELLPGPVDPGCIRLIHHGIANPNRQIENMIGLIDLLDERFRLDFMLVPSRSHGEYYEDLCRRIDAHPRLSRVPAQPTAQIINHINRYDIGLFHLVPINFNLLHFLPNKFFEFVQARLGVAFTPIPEVSPLVRRFGLGVLSDDFSIMSMAKALNGLTAGRVEEMKRAAHAAARELSSERSYEVLRQTVEGVLGARLQRAVR